MFGEKVLAIINNVWESGSLPKEWKHAVIIPIVKPGKKPDNPSSYRPIALTSVLCKIMERMVTDRLVDKLEKSGFFCGASEWIQAGAVNNGCSFRQILKSKKPSQTRKPLLQCFWTLKKRMICFGGKGCSLLSMMRELEEECLTGLEIF